MHVIIADDITGAGDSGVHFAASGRRTALLLQKDALSGISWGALRGHEMVVLSSESRFLDPAGAARTVRQTVRNCRAAGADVVYKKIDSTLRGNPGAEIEAILQEGAFRIALVCPAMPKTGRVVREGKLFLHGQPLETSGGGQDPFNPVSSADVAETLAEQTSLSIANIPLARIRAGGEPLAKAISGMSETGARILIADAESNADLTTIAAALETLRQRNRGGILPVGAGGFAEAIAGTPRPCVGTVPRGRMLAVVGSLTKTSLEQIDYAAAHGGFRPLDMDMEAGLADPAAELSRLAAIAAPGDCPLLLKNRVAPTGRIDVADGVRAANMFAEAARAVSEAAGCSVLYATGGSTAMAVLHSLGVHGVTLERECMPGVVLSSFAPERTNLRWFISKAGGFGRPETIARLAEEAQAQSKQ